MIWRTIKSRIFFLRFSLPIHFTLMSIRRVLRTQIFIKAISIMRLRNQFDLPLMGDDDSLDQQLERVVDNFFNWSVEKDDLYGKEDNYLNWLLNDPSSNSDREEYFRISYWLQSLLKHREDAEKISSSYNSIYNKALEQVGESEIWKIYGEFRKKARRERRLLHKSKTILIDFSPQDVMAFLPLLSIMFVIAGYFHISFLYGHFNVDASQFFSMSDYLAGSIEQIRHALFSLAGFALGIFHQFRTIPTMAQYELQKFANPLKWTLTYSSVLFSFYLFFVFVPIFPIQISTDPPLTISSHPLVTAIAIISVAWTPILFISARYFKNSGFVYSFCMAVTIFFSSLYASTHTEIYEIENGRPKMTFEIRSGGKKYTEQDAIFIGSNSRYVFLYHKEEKNTRIIPLTQIGYISLETR